MIGNVLWIKICFGSNVVCVRLVRRHHHSTGVKKPEYLEEEKMLSSHLISPFQFV